MEISGRQFSEKAEAGEAILAACRSCEKTDTVPLGSYRGFPLELCYESFTNEFQIVLKGEIPNRVSLGISAQGNITRLDNAIAGLSGKLERTEQKMNELYAQREAAETELTQPFPQETELAEKSARLAELDALLNMDDRGLDPELSEISEEEPQASVLADLKNRASQITPAGPGDGEVAR